MSLDFPTSDKSLSLVASHANLDAIQKIGLFLLTFGVVLLPLLFMGFGGTKRFWMLLAVFGLIAMGTLVHTFRTYQKTPPGIRNDNMVRHVFTSGGTGGWMLGVAITAFYTLYYFFPNTPPYKAYTALFDPVAKLFGHGAASTWFAYGATYTFAVLLMGIRAILRYRHNRYQIVRTLVVMAAQFGLAFMIPHILSGLNQPEFYPSYFWPLEPKSMWKNETQWIVIWSFVAVLVITPVLTYYFGKRWYCSWICGCGGLANTFGDPWRHLSDKSLRAWKIERVTVYSVLVIVTVLTAYIFIDRTSGVSEWARKLYGWFIISAFAGVIGVGFYPIFGTRVWCRFGCPMAAILGILQKFFSRFRITTNGSQCISCGNCSKYCEMGIDVRWYAQRGQNVVRASCVGCGMCAAVCPRGVLSLENGPRDNRTPEPISLTLPQKSGIQAAVRTD